MSSDDRPGGRIRRIVVAIDASRHSLAGLEAAVGLARHLNADLEGLFVEDINLVRLGEMPISYQVGRHSLTRQRLTQEQVRWQLTTQSRWAYEAVESRSREYGLRWSFRVQRGSILTELGRAAGEADLTILGKSGWSDSSMLGSTAQALLAQAGRLALILREGVRLGGPVMAVFNNGAASWEALELAGTLCPPDDRRLVTLLIAGTKQSAEAMQSEIESWNRKKGFDLSFLWTPKLDPHMVCSIARTERCGILLLPRERQFIVDDSLALLLNEAPCPALFVGSPGQADS